MFSQWFERDRRVVLLRPGAPPFVIACDDVASAARAVPSSMSSGRHAGYARSAFSQPCPWSRQGGMFCVCTSFAFTIGMTWILIRIVCSESSGLFTFAQRHERPKPPPEPSPATGAGTGLGADLAATLGFAQALPLAKMNSRPSSTLIDSCRRWRNNA